MQGVLRGRGMSEQERAKLLVEVEAMEALLLHEWPGNIRELRSKLDALLRKTHGTAAPGLLG